MHGCTCSSQPGAQQRHLLQGSSFPASASPPTPQPAQVIACTVVTDGTGVGTFDLLNSAASLNTREADSIAALQAGVARSAPKQHVSTPANDVPAQFCGAAQPCAVCRHTLGPSGAAATGQAASAALPDQLAYVHRDFAAAIAALNAELDVMRAPRVTVDVATSSLGQQAHAVVLRLRAWVRHVPLADAGTIGVAQLWDKLKAMEVKHEAVCGLLHRAHVDRVA